ncbi:MAG: hypothetical protein NTZ40_05420 [Cyanobacteria bacterium]|nr:hypothetical protein [Cyanobacteriota bacterium]
MIKWKLSREALRLGLIAGGMGALTSLAGCMGTVPQPVFPLDRRLEELGPSRAPSLAGPWLALISHRDGRDQVVLLNVEDQRPVPLPGLNRPDAQPLSVGVDAKGERLALVRQLEGRTELLVYRRRLMGSQLVGMNPPGVPRRVMVRADGRELAVEVSRDGRWQVDLIAIP